MRIIDCSKLHAYTSRTDALNGTDPEAYTQILEVHLKRHNDK